MSDPEVTPSYRLLRAEDVVGAQRLRELAKWNQTDQDWRNLIAFEPQGCFAAELDGKIVGTATTTRYVPDKGPGSFGWVGMVLVDPEKRRYGIGSTLLKKCIAYLKETGVETVRLDATPIGKQVYDKLGFHDEYLLERWEGTARKVPGGVIGPWSLEPIAARDLNELCAYDTPLFGANRRAILEAWVRDCPEHAVLLREKGKLVGYALARRGSNFHQIGPVVAAQADPCEALLMALLERLADQKVIVDVVTSNAWTIPIALRCGLAHQRPFLRMACGPNAAPGVPGKFLAICCPELG